MKGLSQLPTYIEMDENIFETLDEETATWGTGMNLANVHFYHGHPELGTLNKIFVT